MEKFKNYMYCAIISLELIMEYEDGTDELESWLEQQSEVLRKYLNATLLSEEDKLTGKLIVSCELTNNEQCDINVVITTNFELNDIMLKKLNCLFEFDSAYMKDFIYNFELEEFSSENIYYGDDDFDEELYEETDGEIQIRYNSVNTNTNKSIEFTLVS